MSASHQPAGRRGSSTTALETVVVTRRYRRPPGGWWWLALLLVPLLLALLTSLGGRGAGTARPTPTSTPTPSSSVVDAASISCERFSADVAAILAAHPITFVTNGTRLSASSRATVTAVAGALQRCSTMVATVTGHTDATGSAAINRQISAARAAAVRAALVADGVAPERITSAGAGPDQPVASNDTPEGRAQNRRVEITAR